MIFTRIQYIRIEIKLSIRLSDNMNNNVSQFHLDMNMVR